MKTKKITSLLFIIATLHALAQSPVCYTPAIPAPISNTVNSAYALELNDMNNDGNLDLVDISFPSTGILKVLYGTGTGSFNTTTQYTTGAGPNSMTLNDFNGDGRKDVIVTSQNNNALYIHLSNTTGLNPAVSVTLPTQPWKITSGDLNGDSKIDIAVLITNSISVFFGNGNGTFLSPVNYSITNGSAGNWCVYGGGMAIADINNDAKPDLLECNCSYTYIKAFLNNGTGAFTSVNTYTLPAGSQVFDVIAGDFNSDGSKDIGYSLSNKLGVIYLNNGTVVSTSTLASSTVSGGNTSRIYALDVNGDGKTDLSTCNNYNVEIAFANNSGPLTSLVSYTNIPARLHSMGDLNNDGKIDIATYFYVSGPTGTYNSYKSLAGINPVITAPGGQVCLGKTFTITPSGGTTYSITGGSFTVSPVSNTSYTVTGTSDPGCVNSLGTVVNVTVNPLPTLSIVSSTDALCLGNSATLTASGVNSFTWSEGGNTNNIVVTPGSNTTYTVSGTGANGCRNSASYTQNVIDCTTLNLTEQQKDHTNLFEVYPNPGQDLFYIKTQRLGVYKVTNIAGQVLLSIELKQGENEISSGNLGKGIYFITNENSHTKLIIQ